jgi:hypothetical protein
VTLRIAKGLKSLDVMPIIGWENLSDMTCDIPIDFFKVKVGNYKGLPLQEIYLRELLHDIAIYTENERAKPMFLSGHEEGNTDHRSDEKVIVSTQACILPVKTGKQEFCVNIYNYQSMANDPAVLVIIASDKGTSITVPEDQEQPLYFENNEDASNFVAERLSEYRATSGSTATGKMTDDEKKQNKLYIIQVPLKTKPRPPPRHWGPPPGALCSPSFGPPMPKGMEDAIISVGEPHSPYEKVDYLPLERDPRFPIRVTIQYYKVTDTVDIPLETFQSIKQDLEEIYKLTHEKGSLVTEGYTGRSTEHNQEYEIA